jgi:4'-phosphopantetheinyl transferase EntD
VGSITHVRRDGRGFAGAAVARADVVRSVGLDAETDEDLERPLWRRVLREEEQRWIGERPESEQGFWAKLVFSAKESVYKCQYILSHQFLEFAAVSIAPPPGDATFSASLLVDAPPLAAGTAFRGRYVRRVGYVVSGVTFG